MKISFSVNIKFLSEIKAFEWKWNFWVTLLKFIKQHKTEQKSKS